MEELYETVDQYKFEIVGVSIYFFFIICTIVLSKISGSETIKQDVPTPITSSSPPDAVKIEPDTPVTPLKIPAMIPPAVIRQEEISLEHFRSCMKRGFFVKYIKKGRQSIRYISINEERGFCMYKGFATADDLPKHKPYVQIPMKQELKDCFECDGSDPLSFIIEFRLKSYQFIARSETDHEFLVSGFNSLRRSLSSFDLTPRDSPKTNNGSTMSLPGEILRKVGSDDTQDLLEVASVSSAGENHIYYKNFTQKRR
jgi:hypothetical protein